MSISANNCSIISNNLTSTVLPKYIAHDLIVTANKEKELQIYKLSSITKHTKSTMKEKTKQLLGEEITKNYN